jgi:hypothetical protein
MVLPHNKYLSEVESHITWRIALEQR